MTVSAGTAGILFGVWGTSATNVYAVGSGGLIIDYDGDGDDDTVSDNRWDTPTPPITGNDLYAIWGASANNIYAVGQLGIVGTILNFGGSNWTDISLTVGAGGNLFGIWGSSSADVFVADDTGVIWHASGPTWTPQWTLGGNAFRGIWGSASDDVFTVDFTGGNIYHYNGAVWNTTPMATASQPLTNIWGSSASNVYAIGMLGTLVHYDGTNWSPVTGASTGTNQLTGIWGSSANDIYIVGLGGTILHYDGTAWSDMVSGTLDDLWSVWGTGTGEVFAVGGPTATAAPRILRYTPDVITTTTVPVTTTMPITTTTTVAGLCSAETIYGENSEEAALLRYVRDTILSKTPEGQEIIKLYYQWSPAIVKLMEEDEEFKQDVKEMIDGILLTGTEAE